MTKYYCPHHPDVEVYDDDPKDKLLVAGLATVPTIVQCPVDSKSVYLAHCKTSPGGQQ